MFTIRFIKLLYHNLWPLSWIASAERRAKISFSLLLSEGLNMCDDAGSYPSNSLHVYKHTISICHPQNAHNFFGWEMKWPAPYYLIFSFHSTLGVEKNIVRHSNIHFHICMVLLALLVIYVCRKTFFDISFSPFSFILTVHGRKMYTTQDRTHTTNGWKNIIFYLSSVYILFAREPSEYTLRYGWHWP